jgi:hypothetical protein
MAPILRAPVWLTLTACAFACTFDRSGQVEPRLVEPRAGASGVVPLGTAGAAVASGGVSGVTGSSGTTGTGATGGESGGSGDAGGSGASADGGTAGSEAGTGGAAGTVTRDCRNAGTLSECEVGGTVVDSVMASTAASAPGPSMIKAHLCSPAAPVKDFPCLYGCANGHCTPPPDATGCLSDASCESNAVCIPYATTDDTTKGFCTPAITPPLRCPTNDGGMNCASACVTVLTGQASHLRCLDACAFPSPFNPPSCGSGGKCFAIGPVEGVAATLGSCFTNGDGGGGNMD